MQEVIFKQILNAKEVLLRWKNNISIKQQWSLPFFLATRSDLSSRFLVLTYKDILSFNINTIVLPIKKKVPWLPNLKEVLSCSRAGFLYYFFISFILSLRIENNSQKFWLENVKFHAVKNQTIKRPKIELSFFISYIFNFYSFRGFCWLSLSSL